MAEENNNKDKNNEYEDICYVCRRPERQGRQNDAFATGNLVFVMIVCRRPLTP